MIARYVQLERVPQQVMFEEKDLRRSGCGRRREDGRQEEEVERKANKRLHLSGEAGATEARSFTNHVHQNSVEASHREPDNAGLRDGTIDHSNS